MSSQAEEIQVIDTEINKLQLKAIEAFKNDETFEVIKKIASRIKDLKQKRSIYLDSSHTQYGSGEIKYGRTA